ncbi:MAG TPA: EAL domain-containing protein [Sideroxyarcus sp.]|nr:EAL domain-containing protein [Sideroxyarcus sp.]
MQRLTKLYAALSQCNKAIVHCTDQAELFPLICRDAVEFGGMKMAWIGMVDVQTKQVVPVAWFGAGTEYLESLNITIDADQPSGRGPSGTALREDRPFWCQDFANDPLTAPWHERGKQFGWGASASIPLHCHGAVIGILTLYAGEANAFDEPARNLLVEMAMDVSFALERFASAKEREQMEAYLRESKEKYRALTESINDVIWTLDVETLRFTYVSPSVFKLRGYTPEEIMAQPMDAALTPESAKLVRSLLDQHVEEFLAGRISQDRFNIEEVEQPCKDGSTVWTEVVTNLYQDKKTGKVEVRGVTRNISERKRLEASLLKLSLAVEQSPNTIVITDLDANIEYANANFTKATGYSLDEVIGKNPRMLQSGKTPKATYDDMWAHLTQGESWQGELLNRRKNGSEYIESVLISPVRQADGRVISYLAIKEDITEKKLAEERIEKLAHFDQLTGLPNRSLLNEHFKFALSMAQRSGEQLAVMFLDLDHFKDVNDTLGHSVGDLLLMEMATRLKLALREEDTVSRQGGDEFVLILPDTDEHGAANVAAKLMGVVAKPCQLDLHELISTASIGIAIYPHDGEDYETLSRNADTAMYRAKQEGRNAFRFFTAEMQAHSARALQLGNALRQALARNQLQLQYQPQVSIDDGRMVGVEALLRWQHPELGLISPAEFVPIAEDSGQITHIGEWVLRTAIRQLKDWLDSGLPPMVIAVNLSAAQFRQPNLTEQVTRILDEAGVPHHLLELELTEAVAMDDPQGAIEVMDKLHEHGIRMSIDDFGTGYSSLSYLKRFKVYKLKIDQSFVHDITDDPDDKAIVTAIINMASSLGMQTIAEGVETAGQLAFLRLQGCNEVQGYYFSKPLTAEQLPSYLQKPRP